MSVFRSGGMSSFSSKIGHSAMLPALGNKDVKLLQDMITAEKFVVSSTQRLADDFAKASDALKQWGGGEGDDLWDVLSQCKELLVVVSQSLAQFSTHEGNIRVLMKSIRTREENLDEMKRKKRQLTAKAESAEKKLAKMSSEHKQMPMQRDMLQQLHLEMKQLDSDILVEEARLGDFKRQTTKDWMALKFGGLLELAQKFRIIAEAGKDMIEELPLDMSTPGQGRAPYYGQERTSTILSDASGALGDVIFQPTTGNMSFQYDPQSHSPAQSRFPTMSNNGGSLGLRQDESRYGGGLPPQPEPRPIRPDEVDEFGQNTNPQNQPLTIGGAGPYPPRTSSFQTDANNGARFASMPNRNWGSQPQPTNFVGNNGPPSPAVPPKDAIAAPIPTMPHNTSAMLGSRFSEDMSMKHMSHFSTNTGSDGAVDATLSYYINQEDDNPADNLNRNRQSAAGIDLNEDPYASDAFDTLQPARQPIAVTGDGLQAAQSNKPRPRSVEEIAAANAAAAREIAKELDAFQSESALPGSIPSNQYPPRSTSKHPPRMPTLNEPTPLNIAPHQTRPPILSLDFSEEDARLDMPTFSSASDTPQPNTGKFDTAALSGKRSPPPPFEVATSGSSTPNPLPQINLGTSEPAREGFNASRSASNRSVASTASSLSTLPAPNAPFRSITPTRGTATAMPSMGPASPDTGSSPTRTISVGAFKRFRQASLSQDGQNRRPLQTEMPNNDLKPSNYNSAPSSPILEKLPSGPRPLPTPRVSNAAPSASPLATPLGRGPVSSYDEQEVGLAMGSPPSQYDPQFNANQTARNRLTIGDAGWTPGMVGRYPSNSSVITGDLQPQTQLPLPGTQNQGGPGSRGGYGTGQYSTALD